MKTIGFLLIVIVILLAIICRCLWIISSPVPPPRIEVSEVELILC